MLTQAKSEPPRLPMDRPQSVTGDVYLQRQPVAIIPKTADCTIDALEMTSLAAQHAQLQKKILARSITNRRASIRYREKNLIKVHNLEQRVLQITAENRRLEECIETIKNEQLLKLAKSAFTEEMTEFQSTEEVLEFQPSLKRVYLDAILIDGNTFLGAPSPLGGAETADYAPTDQQKLRRIVECL